MNWITWYNLRSGNRTSRAHAAESFSAVRTFCGWSIPTLTGPAPKTMPRCNACLIATGQRAENRGPNIKRPQQHFLSKDGKTKYLVSRNFPEETNK